MQPVYYFDLLKTSNLPQVSFPQVFIQLSHDSKCLKDDYDWKAHGNTGMFMFSEIALEARIPLWPVQKQTSRLQ